MAGAREVGREELVSTMAATDPAAVATYAIVDIDKFTGLNDQEGRSAGDRCLRLVQTALKRGLPATAQFARVGGDEFAAVLPGLSAEQALLVMDKIRADVEARSEPAIGMPATVSIGVAAYPVHADVPVEAVAAADEAVVRAKRDGRNRVSIYVEDKMVLKSNYYPRAQLARLASLADHTARTEASLLREALADLLEKYTDV